MISPAEQPCPRAAAAALAPDRYLHTTGMFTPQLWPWLGDLDNKGCSSHAWIVSFGENGKKVVGSELSHLQSASPSVHCK